MLRSVRVLLAAIALTMVSGSIASGAGAPFSTVTIGQPDLPKGFGVDSQQTLGAPSTTTWFPTAVALRAHHYQLSFTARFDEFVPNTKPPQLRGIFLELMDRYAASDGALWDYKARLGQRYPRAKLLALKTVGSESSAWNNILGGPPFSEVEILFRQGGYVVELHCAGTLARPATCLHYANVIDTRIRKSTK